MPRRASEAPTTTCGASSVPRVPPLWQRRVSHPSSRERRRLAACRRLAALSRSPPASLSVTWMALFVVSVLLGDDDEQGQMPVDAMAGIVTGTRCVIPGKGHVVKMYNTKK